MGYSPWGHKESDTTERLCTHSDLMMRSLSGGTSDKKKTSLPMQEMLRDVGSSPGSVRSAGEGYGNSFQYFCLENPIDRGTLRATTVHRFPKSWT